MKKYVLQMHLFTFLTILLWGTACHEPVQKKEPTDKAHPTPVKTANTPQFGDVRCILQDKKGNLWFGTRGNGLYEYDGQSFKQFTVNDGLDSNLIYCILEDKGGKIWIGTEAGLCLYDGTTITQIQIPLPKNLPPNQNPYYQSHWVFSMIQTKNGKLWFATIDGVYIYDGQSFAHFPLNEVANGFLNGNAKAERILEDKEGNIWLANRATEGVFRYDGKSITHFTLPELIQDPNGPRPKPHSWGWPQLQDKNGNIWFSNWGGVYRYDGKTLTGFSVKEGLSVTMISQIIEDKKGNLWFSGDALFRYDGKSFTRFTTDETRVPLDGWSILEDARGNIWVGTRDKGIHIFNGKEFLTFSEYQQ